MFAGQPRNYNKREKREKENRDMYNSFAPRIPRNDRNDRLMKEIVRAAEEYEKQPIKALRYSDYMIYFETGSRVEYEACYMEHRRRMNVFAAMALNSENPVWRRELENILWAVCDEFTWAFPAHIKDPGDIRESGETLDLFACETGLALSEICYLMGDRLSSVVRSRVEQEVRRRIIRPYTEKQVTFHKDNWSAVCAGSIGMTVMYWGSRREFEAIEDKVMASMYDFLGSYYDDGCCLEGILYWGYGFGYFCYFARMLREYTGGEKDLFRGEKVKQIALFPQKVYLEKDIAVPFADAPHNYRCHIGLLQFLAKEYKEVCLPDEAFTVWFDEDIRHRFADFIRDFYWYDPGAFEGGIKKQPEGRTVFAGSQWFIKKQRRYDFAAKGGRNNEPHNHNDLGHFILFSGGRFLLDDLGWPEYDSEYFGENRYENLCASSAGHSVPILNGFYQERGRSHASRMILAEDDQVSYDLTKAYPEGACGKFLRSFRLTEKGVLLADEIEGAARITERFVTRIGPRIEGDAVVIGDWRIQCRRPDARILVSEKQFRPRLSICKMDMKPVETAYLIDFELGGADGEAVCFVIEPA